jgi:hypothetical protein
VSGRLLGSSGSPPRDHGRQAGAGPLVWVRSETGVAQPIALDRVRWEHFTGSVPWRRFRSRQGQAHLSGFPGGSWSCG